MARSMEFFIGLCAGILFMILIVILSRACRRTEVVVEPFRCPRCDYTEVVVEAVAV